MQVVVLAGGVGSRLRPWTNSIPKPLLPVLDQTLLEHVVSSLPLDTVSYTHLTLPTILLV